jgi:peptidoglycan/LPS O-acetylase OafA/YrhL
VRRGGVLAADNALAYVRWLQPVTWLLQVMPVFFMVGGFANAQALSRPGASVSRFWSRRVRRLLPPTLVVIATWIVLAVVLSSSGVPDRTVHAAAGVAAQPLWFLAVYLLLATVAPVHLKVHRRAPWLLPLTLPVFALVLDFCRLTGLAPSVAIVNYLVVFMAAQEIGFWYADGDLLRVPAPVLLAAAGGAVAALTLLTTLGPYPVSMVGVPGEAMSNMGPPTLCILVVTIAQVGFLLSARRTLLRWLERPWPWRLTIAANSVVLTLFLWHLTALVAAAALLTGFGALTAVPGTASWWLAKLIWVLLASVVLAGLVAAARPAERLSTDRHQPLPVAAALIGILLFGTGFAELAATGFVDPLTPTSGVLGSRLSPALAVAILVGGGLLATWPRTTGHEARPPLATTSQNRGTGPSKDGTQR